MICKHVSGNKCIECRPDLWKPSDEEIDSVNRSIYQAILVNLVEWNKAYREGSQIVSDAKYDIYEDSLRSAYPDHPFFKMVGHDESKIEEILAFIRKSKQKPLLNK
jgi:hypothetical protein